MRTPSCRSRYASAALTTAACAIALQPAIGRSEVQFKPNLAAELTYTDNVELSDSSNARGETLLQVMPGFELSAKTPRFDGDLEYRLSTFLSATESERNSTFHELEATGSGTLITDLLFIESTARIGQSVIDPTQQIPTSNRFQETNLADAGAWTVKPVLRRRLFAGVEGELAYEYGQVRYFDDEIAGARLDDLDSELLEMAVRQEDERNVVGWSLSYRRQELTYPDLEPLRYDIAQADASYRVTPNLWLLGRGGAESDLTVDQTSGSLDASFWQGGFRWAPSLSHEFSLLAGKRFYDDAYEAEYRYKGRIIGAGLRYEERPATQALDLARRPVFLTDPDQFDPDLTPINPEFYLSKIGQAWVTLTGRRNQIMLQAFHEQREYLTILQDESELASHLEWTYRLGPRTALQFGVMVVNLEYRASDREDSFLNWSAGAQRQLGPRTTLDLTLRHYRRDSNAEDPSLQFLFYRENTVTLGVRFAPR